MIAINKSKADAPVPQCTPHLLPCHIHYDGQVDGSARFWNPQPVQGGQPEAYFRGRKLKGREANIPPGYKGVVLKAGVRTQSGNRSNERMIRDDNEPEINDVEVAIGKMDNIADFGDLIIWGHDGVIEPDNIFVKGVNEWVAFAETMHSFEQASSQTGQESKT